MPISRFSVGTNTRCPGEFTKRPPISISPLSGRSSPATQRSVVVLPHPLGPSRTQNSPSTTSRLIPCKASTRPCRVLNPFRSPLTRINSEPALLGARTPDFPQPGKPQPQTAHHGQGEDHQDHPQRGRLGDPAGPPEM